MLQRRLTLSHGQTSLQIKQNGDLVYESVASRWRRERSRRIEKADMIMTARKMTIIKTLTAVSKKPPSVRIEPSKVTTSRISAVMPPSAFSMNAMIESYDDLLGTSFERNTISFAPAELGRFSGLEARRFDC